MTTLYSVSPPSPFFHPPLLTLPLSLHLSLLFSLFTLIGPKSPIFFKAPRNTTAVAGGRLLLECVARPVTSISWLLNSRPVVTSSRVIVNETVLTVNEVRTSDGGVYTCVVENSYGSVRRSAHVSVTGVDDHSTCSGESPVCISQCACTKHNRT